MLSPYCVFYSVRASVSNSARSERFSSRASFSSARFPYLDSLVFTGGRQSGYLLAQRQDFSVQLTHFLKQPVALCHRLPQHRQFTFQGSYFRHRIVALLVVLDDIGVGLFSGRQCSCFSLFHGGLPQQGQLAGQQLRQLRRQRWRPFAGQHVLTGTKLPLHRKDMQQGPATGIGTDIFIDQVRGNDDCGGVHNVADGVSGVAGHGMFRSEGMRIF